MNCESSHGSAATTITMSPEHIILLLYCSLWNGISIASITTDNKADQYASNCVFTLPLLGDANENTSLLDVLLPLKQLQ